MEDIFRLVPLLVLTFLCTCGRAPQNTLIPATTPTESPERELRGAWLASVLNIDYPQNPTPSAATLQADFRSQLYRLRQAGINVVYVQVRPAGDALYPSAYAPWSEWLTGQQGKAPTSNFDPLAFMIDEAHRQGVEFHAWVNPYRVAMTLDSTGFAPQHLYHQHRDWIHTYGTRRYLDPGLPEVRAHLGRVIDELIAKYDLDGIHFDDYFYPYPLAGQAFPDSNTYRTYGGSRRLADWRRDNVNQFVAETHRRIKAAKPWVQFGISPFGVWRNQADDPTGSATRAGATSYDDLYGDALAWARTGTVDYLLPQLYWSMDYTPASHRVLADWWTANTPPSVDLFFGLGAYKVGENPDPAWDDPQEIPRQIAYDRRSASKGNVFFSAKQLYRNPLGLTQELQRIYRAPVLLPERGEDGPASLQHIRLYKPKLTEGGNLLVWRQDENIPEEE
ncbi:MAG: family 10 glycosylhydrolase, partial [Bacteroidota bacterium]